MQEAHGTAQNNAGLIVGLNSDSSVYGGANMGNDGGVHSKAEAWGEWPFSLDMTIPPLGIVVLKLESKSASTE